MPAALTEYPN